jgi:lipopolysaccharide biosynthesis glycosyltransferase
MTPSSNRRGTITLVSACDDKYVNLLKVMLCSVCENQKKDYCIEVFIFDGGMSDASRSTVSQMAGRYGVAPVYIVPPQAMFAKVSCLPIPKWWPITAYYRIAIGTLLPSTCHKAVYLDCDTLVRGDLAELFDTNLCGNMIAAAADYPWETQAHLPDLLGRPARQGEIYFNSGVLVVDLDLWREQEVERKLFTYTYEHCTPMVDQDALNAMFAGKCLYLDGKYNYHPVPNNRMNEAEAVIIHFVGPSRGRRLQYKYRAEYARYAAIAGADALIITGVPPPAPQQTRHRGLRH